MITFQHVKSGRLTQVMTPEERAAQPDVPDDYRDRTRRRQMQLIAKMDASAKWQRAVAPQLVPEPAPAVSAAPPVVAAEPVKPTESAPVKATEDKPTGPKFTRIKI